VPYGGAFGDRSWTVRTVALGNQRPGVAPRSGVEDVSVGGDVVVDVVEPGERGGSEVGQDQPAGGHLVSMCAQVGEVEVIGTGLW
jgi:hypothetical protein